MAKQQQQMGTPEVNGRRSSAHKDHDNVKDKGSW